MGKSAGNVYGELVCGTIGPKFSTTAPLPKQGGGSTFRTPMGHQRTLFRVPRPNRDPKNEDLAGHGSVRLVFGTPVCRTARSAPLGGRQFLECAAGTFWNVWQALFGVGGSTKKGHLASQRPLVTQKRSKNPRLGQPSVGSSPGPGENVLTPRRPGVGNVGMAKRPFFWTPKVEQRQVAG